MLRSAARFSGWVAVVLMAACNYQGTIKPRVDAGGGTGGGGMGGAAGTGTDGAAGIRDTGSGVEPPVIITGTGTGGGGVSLDANCGVKTQSAKILPPDIMLVMDRSLSMTNDISDRQCTGAMGYNGNCGANSKWQLMIPAINQVITDTDAKVNWGLFYLGAEPAQCGVATAPVVPLAMMNAAAITTNLTGEPFTGALGTPTRRAIQGAVSALTSLTDANPKYILLATDGQPNCATTAANSLNMDDSAGTQQAVADALAMNIPTFVVGIGATGAVAALNATAIAGGRPQTGGASSYYQVDDAAALSTALGAIIGQAASCTFNIGVAPDGTTAVGLGVFGDGAPITMDPANGWSFTDASMTSIIINGPMCDQVMTGTIKDVTIAFVCKPD